MLNKKSVDDINVKGLKVLVRCDFNVPMVDGKITDENRLVAALPTIKKLIADGGKVILCSHMGKPKGEPKPELSLAPVAARLSELLGQEVKFAADATVVGENAKAAVEAMQDGEVVLLENTRYRKEETKNGEEFSKELASLCDVFVNDAFGTAHRAHCSNVGVTKYLDEWKYAIIRCPIWTKKKKIGEDVVLINNTAIRNPSFMHINHYATLLAHNEVSIVDALINVRDSGGVPVAANNKQYESIVAYQNKIFNGEFGVVTDKGGLGVGYAGNNRQTAQDIGTLMETRNKLLRSFYSDIGVRSTFEKKSNVNSREVDGDTSMLLLNVSDMLHQREMACREINRMFGTNWSVHIAEEIDYGAENQELIDNVEIEQEAIDNDVVE